MKTLQASLIALAIGGSPLYADDLPSLPDDTAKINYSVGYQIGSDFKYQQIEIRPDAVIQGLLDALNEGESQLSAAEMKQIMAELGKRLAELKRQEKEELRQQLKEQGMKFHQENRSRPGIVTTQSGLQYRIIEKGHGDSPTLNDRVVVHYTGKLIDGTVFDSSYERGQPASFPVKGVIKGWTEALQLMRPGARWQLFIPYDLAYGAEGSPPKIPPYSSLIFDVDLISVN